MRSKELKAAPARQDCIWIATLRKPVGIKGRVAFAWRDPFSFDSVQLSEGSFAFIERDGLLVPYEIEDLEERGDGSATVALGLVDTVNGAKALQGLRVYVQQELVLDAPSDELYQGDLAQLLVGHYVEDEAGKPVGKVLHVDQYPMNIVLTVTCHDGDEVLLPLSDELLIEMPLGQTPSKDSPLRLRIPEGLL